MLHLETVEPDTFSLLKRLLSLDVLSDFSLVGGTALSLRYGHRISVDLDLFTTSGFDRKQVIEGLQSEFGSEFHFQGEPNKIGLFAFIQGIKVDFIDYPFKRLDDIIVEDSIRFYSSKDIAAMKIQAVLGRAAKKDFWDISELLNVYSLEEMIEFHFEKFPSQMLAISIPTALTYFSEASIGEDPHSLKGQTWESVKQSIGTAVNEYLKE